MFTLSAFADEISPDPRQQIQVLKHCGIRYIEFRSIYETNVMKLSEPQLVEFKAMLDGEGVALSALGSPIGKIPIDAPFDEHMELFKRAIEIAQRFGTKNIRIFSYYPPKNSPFDGNWLPYRNEVLNRMQVKAELAEREGMQLLHENEHNIYGDSPDRVADLIQHVSSPALRYAYDNANWIVSGYDPLDGWARTKEFTTHLHIKDWLRNKDYGVMPGTGDGQIPFTIEDAVKRGYVGFAVMEPHFRKGGAMGGFTGLDLFPYAVSAFRQIVAQAGGKIV